MLFQKICVFGDSIVWGKGDTEKGGWVARLRMYFTHEYNHDSGLDILGVYNMGVSGDTSVKISERFDRECQVRKPDILLCAFASVNDARYLESADIMQTPLETFEANIRELLDQAKNHSEHVILIGLTKVDESKTMPIAWDTRKYYTNENIRKYDTVIRQIARENDVPFIPVFDLLDSNDLYDGLHPNPAGHEKIFQRVRSYLQDNNLLP